MSQRGITTLADIARSLNTTSQAVSNWKYSNHVPSHIITKLEEITFAGNCPVGNSKSSISNAPGQPAPPPPYVGNATPMFDGDTISISKILITMVEQLKVIVLVTLITIFFVCTYILVFQNTQYRCRVSVVLKSYSQNIHTDVIMPPNLLIYPELLRSRLFTERIVNKEFYSNKYKKKLPLSAILAYDGNLSKSEQGISSQQAIVALKENLQIIRGIQPEVLIIQVVAQEPGFVKKLTEVVLVELDNLHRFFTEDVLSGRINFVKDRIALAEEAFEVSMQSINEFNELNSQTLTSVLEREYDILASDMNVKKTKLANLKESLLQIVNSKDVFQQMPVMEVIDRVESTYRRFDKGLIRNVLIAGIFGVGLGVLIGFVRSYLYNQYNSEAEAFKKLKYLIKKKPKDILLDWRISGIVGVFLLAGSPFYFGCVSESPVFFGRYSPALMIVNTIYIMAILTSICLSIYLYRKNIK